LSIKWISNRLDSTQSPHSQDIYASSGQSVFEISKSYIMGINMLDVFRNGVYQQMGVYAEVDENHIRFVEDDYVKEGDIISIRFRNSSLNLGDISVFGSYIDLLNSKNPEVGSVALVTSLQKMYIYKYPDGWEQFVVPYTTKNLSLLMDYEKQPVVNVTNRQYSMYEISYSVGMNSLIVFIDGVKVDPMDFEEIDSQTILFNTDLPTGSSEIEFLSFNNDRWDESFNHEVEYVYYPNTNIAQEIVKIGDNVVRDTSFTYDSSGNISEELVIKPGKSIKKSYSYDSTGNLLKVVVDVVN